MTCLLDPRVGGPHEEESDPRAATVPGVVRNERGVYRGGRGRVKRAGIQRDFAGEGDRPPIAADHRSLTGG